MNHQNARIITINAQAMTDKKAIKDFFNQQSDLGDVLLICDGCKNDFPLVEALQEIENINSIIEVVAKKKDVKKERMSPNFRYVQTKKPLSEEFSYNMFDSIIEIGKYITEIDSFIYILRPNGRIFLIEIHQDEGG